MPSVAHPEGMVVTRDYTVAGMDCAACGATVERSIRAVDGVVDVTVDVMSARARVRHHSGVERARIADAIRRAGYRAEPDENTVDADTADPLPRTPRRPSGLSAHSARIAIAAAAALLLLLGMIADRTDASASIAIALFGLSTIAGGWYVIPRGLSAARNRALDMNFLMSIAALGAWLIGEPTEAAATLGLFAVAELLESYSMDRARRAVNGLMKLSPATASVRRGDTEVRVPVAQVRIGETVVVRPGEKVSVDGEVVIGRSSVDQAPITGESMPVDKSVGDDVFAGSLNMQGVLEIRSTKAASDTTIARVMHAVEEAQASRAPSQRFVDRFSRIYTPAVVVAAVLLAIIPPLLGVGAWSDWTYRALTMLVVACPCALVISTPVTIVSGLAGAAHGGVLVKGGAHLESLGRISIICIDKTGTLTTGRPVLSAIVPLDGHDEREVLRLAIGVEQWSKHPLAHAVIEAGRVREIRPPESSEFESLVGRGARARIDGGIVWVGNELLLAELRLANSADEGRRSIARLEQSGQTALVVVGRERVVGVLGIADDVRANAHSALERLRKAGVQRIVMLTGDTNATAQSVASQLGIDEFRAQLLPDDKLRVVRELESAGQRVAFVGDGVNDAPALAAASVGIAMGAAGTDVALETADVALMADDLDKLAFAVRLSRRTLRIIRQNVVLSLAIKAVFLVLAVGGWATLWMAVAADMGGSLIVVANGLRARRAV